MNGGDIGPSRTKWWGPDRHIVIYYTTRDRSELYFVTSVPEPAEWLTGSRGRRRATCTSCARPTKASTPTCATVLDACPDCHKWAILEREPLPRWSDGRVVLLGDACHPMTPYMAQGAATSIEDAAVLGAVCGRRDGRRSRGCVPGATRPTASRARRASRRSPAPTLDAAATTDTAWLYGYDAWNAPLVEGSKGRLTRGYGQTKSAI